MRSLLNKMMSMDTERTSKTVDRYIDIYLGNLEMSYDN